MQKKVLLSQKNDEIYQRIFKAAAIFIVTVTTDYLLRDLNYFVQAAEDNKDNDERRALSEIQQNSSAISIIERSRTLLGDIPTDIEIAGNYAFITTQDTGLNIIDVTNTVNPRFAGNITFGVELYDIDIANNFAYLAADRLGLLALDISNPTNPIFSGNYSTAGVVNKIAIAGNKAFLINTVTAGNISVVDISMPNQFKNFFQGYSFQSTSFITDMVVDGTDLFKLDAGYALTLSKVDTSTLSATSIQTVSSANDVVFSNNYAYVATNTSLQIINLINPANPQLLGSWPAPSNILALVITNDLAYLATGNTGLQIINITDPINPQFLGRYITSGCNFTASFAVKNKIVFITDVGNQLFLTIDTSSPANPNYLGGLLIRFTSTPLAANSPSPTCGAVRLAENRVAYIANCMYDLFIIDVIDVRQPALLATYQPQFVNFIGISAFGLNDTLGYVCGGGRRFLTILNLNNPISPIQVGGLFSDCGYGNLHLNHKILYTPISQAIAMFDVNDNTNPKLMGRLGLPCATNFLGAHTVGHVTLIADGACGLGVIAHAPMRDNFLTLQGLPLKLTIANNRSYVIDINNNLYIIDLKNRDNLTTISNNYKLIDYPKALIVIDDYLYIAEGTSGIEVVDIRNPSLPILAVQLTNNLSDVRALTFNNGHIYVTDAQRGLIIYDIQGQPLLLNHQFAIIPGVQFTVTTEQLSARDTNFGANPLQLNFFITSLQNGQFQLSSQPGISISNFTQAAIVAGNVIFVPTAMPILPTFQVSVTNGRQTTAPQNMTMLYAINAPRMVNNSLTINQGQTVTLTNYDLGAISLIPGRQLTFTINQIRNGRFQSAGAPGIFITTFSPQEILQRTVQFVATGSDLEVPGYVVIVNDGVLSSLPSNAAINFNAAPQIVTNQLAILQGATVTMSSSNLQATDVDNDPATLLFTMTGVQYGSFNQVNFTQKALTDGLIQFTQDGSTQNPIYFVNVSDGRINVGPKQAVTSLTQPSTDNIPIIAGGIAAGATFVAGVIGVSFWLRKRTQDANTRKQFTFADYIRENLKLKGIDNFNSQKGGRYISIIRKLEYELARQGSITVSNMGDREQRVLAQQVATSARNKITPSTSCGYSIIRPEDIDDQKISEIVQDVLRMRVGQDDKNVPMAAI